MAITHTKTCQECGAANAAEDLFCKECGASLATVSTAAEQTNAFTPVQPVASTQTTAVEPAMTVVPQPVQQYSYDQPTSYGSMPQQESARGAVLGWLAATLMLVIVGFYLWSSVISDATRDRFTGWF